MVMEGDLTWDGEHTIQFTDDVLQTRTPEPYVILLTKVTPTNSIKKEIEKKISHENLISGLQCALTVKCTGF